MDHSVFLSAFLISGFFSAFLIFVLIFPASLVFVLTFPASLIFVCVLVSPAYFSVSCFLNCWGDMPQCFVKVWDK